jgi:hypothetical protein
VSFCLTLFYYSATLSYIFLFGFCHPPKMPPPKNALGLHPSRGHFIWVQLLSSPGNEKYFGQENRIDLIL